MQLSARISARSTGEPLVTDEWSPVDSGKKDDTGKINISNIAKTPEFTLKPGNGDCKYKIWLVFADMFNRIKPKEGSAGGALGYFWITVTSKPALTFKLFNKGSAPASDFDWDAWHGKSGGQSRLIEGA